MTICKVHNIKFYNLDANGIICMAYEKERQKLALSRSDSTIEIWDLSHMPHIERTIPSRCDSSIEALSWFDERLFSVGLQGLLVEYNLYSLSQKYSIQFTGVLGWCLDIHKDTANLAIGTEQGYVNIYKVTEEGVDYVKLLDKQDGKIYCLKYNSTGEFIASGSVDTIRVWNVKTGHVMHRMNVSRSVNKIENVVYCLTVTDDFTIISGDSRGYLTFWDGKLGSQIESHQSHCAAILSVCLSDNHSSVFCSGLDPLIMSYEKIKVKGNSYKWVKSTQRKIHEYEVRSLFVKGNELYCGGVDGYISRSSPPKTLIKYAPLLQNPCVCISREAKLIMLRYPRALEVWSFGEDTAEEYQDNFFKLKEVPKKLLELQTKQDDSTLCANISNNGRWIVYSTISQVRVFHFNYEDNKPELMPINLPVKSGSCVRVEFTSDSKQLILAPSKGGLVILNIVDDQLFLSETISTSKILKDTITFLQISADGNYLVAADPESNIAVWSATDNKWKYHCKLPKYRCSPASLGIHPRLNSLVVVYSDNKVIEYNLKKSVFTAFSSKQNSNSARKWLSNAYPISNVSFDPSADHIILLHDDSTIYVIDKEKTTPVPGTKIPKLDSSSELERCMPKGIKAVKKDKHLVYFGCLDNNEMVCVELQPVFLQKNLRPILPKKKFGLK